MKYFDTHFKVAENILLSYQYPEPFHIYLKRFFKHNKKFGKRDRDSISDIAYTLLRFQSIRDESHFQEIIQFIKQSYVIQDHSIHDYRNHNDFKLDIPQKNWPALSIDKVEWEQKIRIQPFVFIQAINPEIVKQKLDEHQVQYAELGTHTLALDYKIPLHNLLLPHEYYVQDYSCQLATNLIDFGKITTVWDACAASGGKSLGMLMKKPSLELFASDNRAAILENYRKRLALYGFKNSSTQFIDLTKNGIDRSFDLVWCDVPCSGSGTWGRNPEHLQYFEAEQIQEFVNKQSLILQNCWSSVKKNGILIYTTCSVFAEENEEQVKRFINSSSDRNLLESRMITGDQFNSDYLFMAVIRKN